MATRFQRHQSPSLGTQKSKHSLYDIRRYAHPELGPVARFRSSGAWQRTRGLKAQESPYCYDPFREHGPGVTMDGVHHIFSLQEGLRLGRLQQLGLHPLNLVSLCAGCHQRIEQIWRSSPEESRRFFLPLVEEQFLCAEVKVSYDPEKVTSQG